MEGDNYDPLATAIVNDYREAQVYTSISAKHTGDPEIDAMSLLQEVMSSPDFDERTADRIAIWFFEKYRHTKRFDNE